MKTLILLCITFSGYHLSAQNDEARIRSVMAMQQDCWNAGDLECFMRGYWNSDHLVFVSRDTVIYGWETTLARYQKKYPDQATMGQLTFTIISLEPLNEDHWYMIGKWYLEREIGNIGGHFTLIWRRIGDEWVIISDHTS